MLYRRGSNVIDFFKMYYSVFVTGFFHRVRHSRMKIFDSIHQMSSSSSSSSSSGSTIKVCSKEDVEEDMRSLVLFLLGSVGYELEADRVARVSKRILESEQIVEGISRFQFPTRYHPYKIGRTRLMYAAKVGNLQRLNFIAGLGARVNMTAIGESGLSKHTALHFASYHGHTDCVRSLCDRGAMIDAQAEGGQTALHLACSYGHLDVARLLCERGAQIDLQDIDGWTALFYASDLNNIAIARYLCEKGANTLLGIYSETPYARACQMHGVDSPMALLLKSYPH